MLLGSVIIVYVSIAILLIKTVIILLAVDLGCASLLILFKVSSHIAEVNKVVFAHKDSVTETSAYLKSIIIIILLEWPLMISLYILVACFAPFVLQNIM